MKKNDNVLASSHSLKTFVSPSNVLIISTIIVGVVVIGFGSFVILKPLSLLKVLF